LESRYRVRLERLRRLDKGYNNDSASISSVEVNFRFKDRPERFKDRPERLTRLAKGDKSDFTPSSPIDLLLIFRFRLERLRR